MLRARLSALRALVCSAVLVLSLAAPAAAGTSVPDVPTAFSAASSSARVVLFAVPGLRWDDVSATGTPTLWQLVGRAALGALTDRSARSATDCVSGWLTFGAGNRAGDAAPRPGCMVSPHSLPLLRRVNHDLPYGAELGALGQALHAGGLRTAALGPGARLALGDRAGAVDVATENLPEALAGADVVLVADTRLLATTGSDRRRALHDADRELGRLLAAVSARTNVLVFGPSDPAGAAAHLHVAVATGPAFAPGVLRSAGTATAPFVELIDVAPTVLALTGQPVPTSMVGRAWSTASPPSAGTAATVRGLVELDLAAQSRARVGTAFTALLVALDVIVGVGLAALIAWRRRARWLQPVAYGVAALPAASFLAQAVPWWRYGAVVFAAVAASSCVLAAAGGVVAARRWSPYGGLVAVAAGTAALLIADVLAGTPLQRSSVLGDSALEAGRFHGVGNLDFALLATAVLLVIGVVPRVVLSSRRQAAIAVGVLGVAVLVLDGLPALGDDDGGVLALGPAVLLLVFLTAGARLRWPKILAVVAAGVVPIVALAAYDYALPVSRQSHLGRFVGQLLHGDGGTVVHRKAMASLGQFTHTPLVALLPAAVIVLVLLARRRGDVPSGLGEVCRRTPGLAPALIAVAVCAVLGGALNDSGVALTGAAASLALPLLVAASAGAVSDPPRQNAARSTPRADEVTSDTAMRRAGRADVHAARVGFVRGRRPRRHALGRGSR